MSLPYPDYEFFIQLCVSHNSLYKIKMWKAVLLSDQPLTPKDDWTQPRVINSMHLGTRQVVETQEIPNQVWDSREQNMQDLPKALRYKSFRKNVQPKTTCKLDVRASSSQPSLWLCPIQLGLEFWASCPHCHTNLPKWKRWLNGSIHGSHSTQYVADSG